MKAVEAGLSDGDDFDDREVQKWMTISSGVLFVPGNDILPIFCFLAAVEAMERSELKDAYQSISRVL